MDPDGQVLLGQARPGPVEAQLRAEHACGRPGSVGIGRYLIGILSESDVADLSGAQDAAEATRDAIQNGAAVIYQETLV